MPPYLDTWVACQRATCQVCHIAAAVGSQTNMRSITSVMLHHPSQVVHLQVFRPLNFRV